MVRQPPARHRVTPAGEGATTGRDEDRDAWARHRRERARLRPLPRRPAPRGILPSSPLHRIIGRKAFGSIEEISLDLSRHNAVNCRSVEVHQDVNVFSITVERCVGRAPVTTEKSTLLRLGRCAIGSVLDTAQPGHGARARADQRNCNRAGSVVHALAPRWKVLDFRAPAGKGYGSVHRAARRRPYRAVPTLTGGWRGLWACVIALLVATSPIASLLHRAFVPHVICEHGDLVEPGESTAPPNASRRVGRTGRSKHPHDPGGKSLQSRPRPLLGGDARSQRTHHACSQLALSTRIEPEVALFRPPSKAEPRLLLLIAPKTSPPAHFAG